MKTSARDVVLADGRKTCLRSPEAEDAGALLAHLRVLFHEAYVNLNFAAAHFDGAKVDDQARRIADFNSAAASSLITATHDGRIVGNLALMAVSGEFQRFNCRLAMGVEKAFTGVGLGRALMSAAIDQAKIMGHHRIELSVRTYNLAGIALYERSGFRRVGTLRDIVFIDGTFHDEFLYELVV